MPARLGDCRLLVEPSAQGNAFPCRGGAGRALFFESAAGSTFGPEQRRQSYEWQARLGLPTGDLSTFKTYV